MGNSNAFGYIRAKNYVKINVFKKGIQKCSYRVPVSVVYLFTCIHVLMPQFPKKIGDPRFLTDNYFFNAFYISYP